MVLNPVNNSTAVIDLVTAVELALSADAVVRIHTHITFLQCAAFDHVSMPCTVGSSYVR